MEVYTFEDKIYYTDMKNIDKFISLGLIAYLMTLAFEVYLPNFTLFLEKICILVSNIILLMFIIHIRDIRDRRIYVVIEIFFIINCVIGILILTPEGQFTELKYILNSVGFKRSYRLDSITLFGIYYLLAKYKNSNDKLIYLEYGCVFLLDLIIQSSLILNYNSHKILIYTYVLSIIILFLKTNVYMRRSTLLWNGKLNLFKLNFIMLTITAVINLISYFLDNALVSSAIYKIQSLVFIVSIICIIKNISQENYNYVYKEIYETNRNLEKINDELIDRNYELLKSQKTRLEYQNLYKNFLENLSKPVITYSRFSKRILYCNKCFMELIGEDNLRNIINKKVQRFIDISMINEEVDFENNEKTYKIFVNGISNKIFNIKFIISSEDKMEVVMIIEDITEKVKIEEMKKELANKEMNDEIKKNFLSNISHDLKIPINVIYSAIQLEQILKKKEDIEGIKKYNFICKSNCVTLARFANNLIDISKISMESLTPSLTKGNIVEFVEENVLSLEYYIRSKNIELIFDTDEEEIYIFFDVDMMRRIILNLISNAVKFTPTDGKIYVNIKNHEKRICIEIIDTGIGMGQTFTKEAFEKYSMEKGKSNNVINGSGIGLFVVYNLIQIQGGDIKLDSEVGKGTQFTIELPKESNYEEVQL
ncbi:PAS domain-containing sensor histidine kinase [Clostridium carnis]